MPEKKYKVAFMTLGCRVNQYETRAVEESFKSHGFEIGLFDEKCDVYVINTCTVTAESDRKSVQMIRRARSNGGNDAVVIAMGCMVQVNPDRAEKIDGLDYAFGNKDKLRCVDKAVELLGNRKGKAVVESEDISGRISMDSMHITGSDNTRAFLKISDGCNNNCAYCIIPKARGNVCSKPARDVCEEVKALAAAGYKETVLTGIETAAYGKDFDNTDLVSLIEEVNDTDCGIKRIRLGSLEPTVVKQDNVKRLSKCKKLMPHYHLSLQSGSDAILRAMRRKYNTRMFFEVVTMLRENIPDVTLTTDIIVGFPGETDEMFAETCEFVKKCGFLFVHIFPYSDRAGTDASKMSGKLTADVKKKRAAELKKVMLETRKKVLEKYYGTDRPVLVETVTGRCGAGHTDNFIEVQFDIPEKVSVCENDIVRVKLVCASEDETYVKSEYVR